MAYLGQSPLFGNFTKLDDISSLFDGTRVLFDLKNDGEDVLTGSPYQLLISINGVLQDPGVAFTIYATGNQILFTEAPAAGATFFALKLGDVFNFSTVASNSITSNKLTDNCITTSKIIDLAVTTAKINDLAVTTAKITDSSVTGPKIADNSITVQKLYTGAVTFSKINSSDIASQVEAETGTEASKLVTPLRVKQFYDNSILGETVIFEHHTTGSTLGGSTTSGSWRTRTLTRAVNNGITDASLASNVITLPAGTYDIKALSQYYFPGTCVTRLRNTTNNTTLLLSNIEYTGVNGISLTSNMQGIIVLEATSTLELQYWIGNGGSNGGGYTAINTGEDNIWARINVKKIL